MKQINNEGSRRATEESTSSSAFCKTFDQPLKTCSEKRINGLFYCSKNRKINSENTNLENVESVIGCIVKGKTPMSNIQHFRGSVAKHQGKNLTDLQCGIPSLQGNKETDDVHVQIPQEALRAAIGSDDEVNSAIIWFKGGLFPVHEANSSLLNDRVLAIELGKAVSGLTRRVNITFFHQNSSLENATCTFLDRGKDGSNPIWNSSGCSTEQGKGEIVCSCDHLSFFALLLSPVYENEAGNGTQVSGLLSSYSIWLLTLLSRIGCGVSVCCLALVIAFHAIYRWHNSEHSLSIHIHLCVALLGLNLSFLANDSMTSLNNHGVCIFIAAATHYYLLCTITWFAIEGFHLYWLVIRVFNVYIRRYLLKLALVGWGLPAVAVISILSCGKYGKYNIYQLEGGAVTMCYLPESVLLSITFSFFALVVLLNLLVFVAVTVHVVRARRLSLAQQERHITRKDIFSLMGVSWLLGLSWGVLLFPVSPLKEVIFYIFCILNSLHGVFVCVRYFTLHRRPKESPGTMLSTVTTTTDSVASASVNNRERTENIYN
ncbi:adhesion G protein-coupled receptor G3-like [Conger conger]|uniref:adhesion G protein-coupled receptor G3-like n=1 Tax=Conger conger TaxID=82655 RepID=UPI002A59F6F7|nr:adhesion G protein-coupled receptor G3-like [Conger conger]